MFHFLMFHLLLQLFRPSRQRGHHTGHVHGNGVFLRTRVQNGHQLTQQTVRFRQRWTDLDHVGRIFALHGVPLGPCLANITSKRKKRTVSSGHTRRCMYTHGIKTIQRHGSMQHRCTTSTTNVYHTWRALVRTELYTWAGTVDSKVRYLKVTSEKNVSVDHSLNCIQT